MDRPGRNDVCWCGSGLKYKKCHCSFDDKIEHFERMGVEVPTHDMLKMPEHVEKIKESAKINVAVLDYIEEHIKAGVTTAEIDKWVYDETVKRGGIPAPLNYQNYPKSVCTSIDDVVCHGIPDENRILQDGDIVNVDCSTILDGYFSDSSRMFIIGETTPEKKRLVEVAKQSLQVGLDNVKPWTRLGDMSQAINDFVKENGFSVVREIGGHGVGFEFHEEPYVCYTAPAGTELLMVPGFMFTIEPMINMGKHDVYTDEDDGWTVYTEDGLPSAQWEVQVLVTEDGYEVISW